MACSYKPLTELSKHFSPSLLSPPDSSPTTSSFRASASPHASGSGSHTSGAIEQDWSTFTSQEGGRAAGSQIEAMPPFASSSSSPFASFGPGQTRSTFAQEPVSTTSQPSPADDNLSPFWNPEQEALRYLSSSPAPSSTSSLRSTYSVPTPDEAASISSTPLTSASTSLYPLSKSTSLDDHFSPPSTTTADPTSQTPPHPLTYTAPVHTAWDFDKLFSGRRRWFGGVRVPSEGFLNGEAGVQGEETERSGRSSTAHLLLERQEAQDRARSVERAGSRGRREGSRLCVEIGEEERQRMAFEGLRKVAMDRLKAVGSHLDWEGGS